MKAVVLAAGFATRLHPLTRDRAKPLLDVAGRPVLSRLMDRVLAVEVVDEAVVVVNARFHAQFAAWREDYLARVPVRLVDDGATDETQKLGAIADLGLALEAIDDDAADLLVVAGDNLVDFDLAPFVARYREVGTPLLLVREIVGPVPPRTYNEVTLGPGGRVLSFREKPADPRTSLSAICLYLFPGSVRRHLATYLAEESNHDAPGYFLEWLHARVPVTGARLAGAWHDIGSTEALERARAAFAAKSGGR